MVSGQPVGSESKLTLWEYQRSHRCSTFNVQRHGSTSEQCALPIHAAVPYAPETEGLPTSTSPRIPRRYRL
jgi:hypothetical protein